MTKEPELLNDLPPASSGTPMPKVKPPKSEAVDACHVHRAKLAEKLNAIAHELGQVKNDGHNVKSNYDYISYEQVNAKLRNLLPKHKVAIIPAMTSVEERDYKMNDKVAVRSVVQAEFRVIDTETGYSETSHWCGAGIDVGGKSLGIAITETQKRFVLKLLHISTKGDEDGDSGTTELPATALDDRDPVAFIREHASLKEQFHNLKLKESDIRRIVPKCGFDEGKVKAELDRLGEF